jgi:integrase
MPLRLHLRTERPSKKTGECPIVINYHFEGKNIFIKLKRKMKILPKFWNKKAVYSWVTPDYGDTYQTYNRTLAAMLKEQEEKVNEFYLKNKREPNLDEMRFINQSNTSKSFFALFDEFTKYQTTSRGQNNIKDSTLKNYTKTRGRLEKYQAHTGVLDFNYIDMHFYDKFNAYCTSKFGNEIATISSYIKIIKTFLKWARIHQNISISDSVIATLKEINPKRYKVTFTIEEVYKLRDMEISDPLLDNARDASIVQIGLSCRFGDLTKLLTDNVSFENGQYIFRMITQKTETYLEFPLSQMVVNVLRKHEGQHPKDWIPAEQKQNKRLKELGKLLGMFQPIPIIKGTGIYRKDIIKRRFEMIGTHTCRRTSVNLMQQSGMRDVAIGNVTGQSIQTVQRYKYADSSELQIHNKLLDYKPETGKDTNNSPEPKQRD